MNNAQASYGGAAQQQDSRLTSSMEGLKDKASEVYEGAKDVAGRTLESAQSTGAAALAKGKDVLQDVASSAGEAVTNTFNEQKSAGADAIARAAQAVRETAQGFEKESPEIARLINTAANSVENLSRGMKEKTITEMLEDVSGFAERRPLTFLATGVVGGLLLARLLSTSDRS